MEWYGTVGRPLQGDSSRTFDTSALLLIILTVVTNTGHVYEAFWPWYALLLNFWKGRGGSDPWLLLWGAFRLATEGEHGDSRTRNEEEGMRYNVREKARLQRDNIDKGRVAVSLTKGDKEKAKIGRLSLGKRHVSQPLSLMIFA